jgi:mono/diheme cytochrome c family protein
MKKPNATGGWNWSAVCLVLAIPAFIILPSAFSRAGHQPVSVEKGRALYDSHCSNCHGDEGRGDGNLASVLSARPTDLTSLARESGGEFPLEMVIKIIDGREEVKTHRPREMPIWGDAFKATLPTLEQFSKEEQSRLMILDIAEFLRSIQETDQLPLR